MPHCFLFILNLSQPAYAFETCVRICKECMEKPESVTSVEVFIDTLLKTEDVDVKNLVDLTVSEVRRKGDHQKD